MFKQRLLLGQYYPARSAIHNLTARNKILITLLYMIALLVADDWLGWGLLAIAFVVFLAMSRIPISALWRGLKVILIFCLITLLLNIFVYPGEPIWSWGFLSISSEGVSYGLAMALRLMLLVAFASLLTLTTTPVALTDGLESLLSPLKVIKVPAHEIAMMMSIALRFIPTILEEFDRIILAQKARGANIVKGNFFQRARAMVPLLVPLFVAAFRRAEDLAQAMEAKCYRGGEGRTRWKVSVWRWPDTLSLLIFVALLLLTIALRMLP
jgi:energy-coupling factor transport system permease protein